MFEAFIAKFQHFLQARSIFMRIFLEDEITEIACFGAKMTKKLQNQVSRPFEKNREEKPLEKNFAGYSKW